MNEPARPDRCVIVVDHSLPTGLAANAAAVLALSIGAQFPHLPGRDFLDADGAVHPGLIPMGLPILSAPADRLTVLRAAALDLQLYVVDFPAAGQQTTDYAAFAAGVSNTPTDALTYLGLALCGPSRPIRKLTGGYPLLR